MIRFFVAPSDISGGNIKLSQEDAAHIRSLRLRPTELFIACDGEGTDHICRLAESGEAAAVIVQSTPSAGEPTVACSVYIAFAKGERLDYAVQKSIELGAAEVVLFPSERCIALPRDLNKKTARLQRIARETAKQSGRGRVPEVRALGTFEAAVEAALQHTNRAHLPLFLYECEEDLHLKKALETQAQAPETSAQEPGRTGLESVSIMTGPEGGFEPHEAEHARAAGLTPITLGPRILRCETAPIAALAAIMYHTGNL